MAVAWLESLNGKAHMGFVAALGADESVDVYADDGEIWKVINIFQEGSLEIAFYDPVNDTTVTFRTTLDQADSLEYLNWQIQDSGGGYLKLTNKSASAQDIMIDTIVWG